MFSFRVAKPIPAPKDALPGRPDPMETPGEHYVLHRPLVPPFPPGTETLLLGMGCFWGAERLFWSLPGVYVTAVGYSGGFTPNPTYREVCSGMTGHTEVVLVVYYPSQIQFSRLIGLFLESHDPTQGMRQGNDVGTQYRSAVYTFGDDQALLAKDIIDRYGQALAAAGHRGLITTELASAGPFYYAEDYHQQYLAKNPGGYCGLAGTGVTCPS
jgi:peptide-methionine (S)-S-oxide reductase